MNENSPGTFGIPELRSPDGDGTFKVRRKKCLILRKHMTTPQAVGIALCFFAVLSAAAFALLRGISYLSQRTADKLNDAG